MVDVKHISASTAEQFSLELKQALNSGWEVISITSIAKKMGSSDTTLHYGWLRKG